MNKFMKSLLITGIVASNATAVLATTPQNVRVLEQRVATSATLKAEQASVRFFNYTSQLPKSHKLFVILLTGPLCSLREHFLL